MERIARSVFPIVNFWHQTGGQLAEIYKMPLNTMTEHPQPEAAEEQESDSGVLVTQTVEQFFGPIPPPHALAQYEKVHPGLADRIVKMAESQSEHRKDLETKVILHDRLKSTLGLVFAFVIVIMAILAGVYLVIRGEPLAGGFISMIPLGTIVGAFIYQQRGKEDE